MLESTFNKVAGLIKKKLQHRCFPVNIANLLRPPILKNTIKRLPLYLLVFAHISRGKTIFAPMKSVYFTDQNIKVYE